jgi:eukaryotic-like serine/threonine-protein kinase
VRKAFDLGLKAASRTASDRIAVIAEDDRSIASFGCWPWLRDVHARMIEIFAAARAKVIANSTFFFGSQADPGLNYINRLLDFYGRNIQQTRSPPVAAAPGYAGFSGVGTVGQV